MPGIPISELVGDPNAFHNHIEEQLREPRFRMTYAVLPDAVIHVETLDAQARRLSSWVVNTRDSLVRQALIDLGWTPPAHEKDLPDLQEGPRVGQTPAPSRQAGCQQKHPPSHETKE